MAVSIGSRFYSVDFHVHTPASRDYKDKSATASDIVDAAIQAGLDAIAITDHNTFEGIESIKKAAEGRELVIFPGVEITAIGGHVLGIFDPSRDLADLDDVLTKAGIDRKDRGREEAIGKEFTDVMAVINSMGGIAIAAHADGPKGFMTTTDQGQAKIRIYKDMNLFALELLNSDKKEQYVLGKIPDYDRCVGCIQGSDSHSISTIGSRKTYLRMQRLSLIAIKQALKEPLLRVKLPEEWDKFTAPYISKVRVSQGYLGNQEFHFNPSLNCIVGGAGSGKSTVIEFIRFALDQISKIDHIREDCIGKLTDLAPIGTTIEVQVVLDSGDEFSIERTFLDPHDLENNPIKVRRISDGQAEEIDATTFFPIHAYSQGEAISISRSPLAQLELIDKHLNLSKYREEIAEAYRELAEQSMGLTALEAKVKDKDVVKRALTTADERIKLLTQEQSELAKIYQNPVVASHQLWIAEKNYLAKLVDGFKDVHAEIKKAFV